MVLIRKTQKIVLRCMCIVFILWMGVSFNLSAQEEGDSIYFETDTINILRLPSDEDWDFFDVDEVLRLSLAFDVKTLVRQKRKDAYQDAVLTLYIDSQVVERNIRIKARGERRLSLCTFPPIKFNFKKVDSSDVYVGDETTLKLVTHCKSGGNYRQWVLKEFLIYKLYNVLTDFSFKVRLTEIEYIDTGKKGKQKKKYGFLIEHLRDLAIRNDAYFLGKLNQSQKRVDKEMLALMGVFQFMVGNTDWSTAGPHNVKYIRLKDSARLAPVTIPYDFDYSGMVDADYAVPRDGLNLEDVTERYYSVWCLPRPIMEEVITLFREKRPELYDVIGSFTLLEKWQQTKMIRYLDSFYQILDSEEATENKIIKACLDK